MALYNKKLDELRKHVMIGVEQHQRGDYIEINSDKELDAFF